MFNGMKVVQIVAVSDDNAIGGEGDMLWHISEDFKFFKEFTMGNALLMGRKTIDSLPNKLKGRVVVGLTGDTNKTIDSDIMHFSILDAALRMQSWFARQLGQKQIIIAGGASVYEQTKDITDEIYLTKIHESFSGSDKFYTNHIGEDFTFVGNFRNSIKVIDKKSGKEVWVSFRKYERMHIDKVAD